MSRRKKVADMLGILQAQIPWLFAEPHLGWSDRGGPPCLVSLITTHDDI